MLFDDDMSDDEKTFVVGVHHAPDMQMQKERANGEYIGLVRNVAVDYPTLDHETTLRDQYIASICRHAQAPTTAMLELADVERQRRMVLKGGGGVGTSDLAPGRAVPHAKTASMTYTEIHSVTHKGNNRRVDAAEIAADESTQDTVFKGPPHLYREPRLNAKLASILKNSKFDPLNFESIPTSSQAVPLMKQPMTSGSTEFGLGRARRGCQESMREIMALCETYGSTFVDVPFFQGSRSTLYPTGTASDSRVVEPRDVKRVTNMFPNIPLFDNELSAEEPVQWMIAAGCRSTHIIAALSALTLSEEGRSWIESLLVYVPSSGCTSASDFFEKHRFIGVMLYVNGSWEWTIVDDLIAVGAPNQPSFLRLTSSQKMFVLQTNFEPLGKATSKGPKIPHRFKPALEDYLFGEDDPVELWPYLLHKAIAKIYGSIDAVDGGVPRRIFRMLTGREAIGATIGAATTSDAFTELVEERSALVWMLDRQPSMKAPHDHRSGCVMLNFDTIEPVWIPTDLPLVVEKCFHSVEDVASMVRLRSPWGCLRSSGECTIDVRWEDFVKYFSYAEVCASTNPEPLHHVQACNVSPVPAEGGTINGNPLPEATQDLPPTLSQVGPTGAQYYMRLNSPLPAPTTITLFQGNPHVHKGLPYATRKGIPFAALGLRVVSEATGQVMFKSEQPHVDEELTIEIVLNPGTYIITSFFYNCPRVPFCVRAAASSLTNLQLWPVGLSSDVHGVTTQPRQTEKIESLTESPSASLSPREQKVTETSSAASASFRQIDLLHKGVLSARGAHQAAFHFFMENTEQGKSLARVLKEVTEKGDISENEFSKAMYNVFPPM